MLYTTHTEVYDNAARRGRVDAVIADSYRRRPQTPADDEFAMASAIALTEAEPW